MKMKLDSLAEPIRYWSAGYGLYWRNNDRRLAEFRNIHHAQRAFILGTGPSVRHEDLERMDRKVSFAVNRFYLAYPNMKFRPTYTVCMDLLALKNHGARIAENCGTPLFIAERSEYSKTLRATYDNVITFKETPVKPLWDSNNPEYYYFSTNPVQVVGFGFGVIYTAMQLAVWMGVKEIILYGIDHSFKLPRDYLKPGVPVTHGGEQNYFIPNYREIGENWAPPNLPKTEAGFRAARMYCERNSIKIWNSTRDGKLEIFERRPIDEVLSEK